MSELLHFVDSMHCILPSQRELQFAAMAVLQSYVKSYEQRMKASIVKPDGKPLDDAKFILNYSLDISEEDLQFFYDAGLQLAYIPQKERVQLPAMLLDFSEEAVLPIVESTGKHVCQVYGMLCGVEDLPLPELPKVKPRLANNHNGIWGILPGVEINTPFGGGQVVPIDGRALCVARDGQYSGIVGLAGWETYMSCAKGIPTIEYLPEGRGRTWLSKWAMITYRAISYQKDQATFQHYADQARHNLEMVCSYLAEKERMDSCK